MTKEIFASNVKKLRQQRGYSQERLAKKIGVKRSLIGAWEEQRSWPTFENLFQLCDLFGNMDSRKFLTEPIP